MTDDPRGTPETISDEIRNTFANMHLVRRKLNEMKEHFSRQLKDGTITWFRYDVEMTDIIRLQRTLDGQWLRLQ